MGKRHDTALRGAGPRPFLCNRAVPPRGGPRKRSRPGRALLVVARRSVAGGVQARDAVGLAVGGVAAAVDGDDGRGDPLLELFDLEATGLLLLLVHGGTPSTDR